MLPGQSRIDIFDELERLDFGRPLVPKAVLRELEGVAARGGPRDRTAARIGLELATTRCEIIPDEVGGDLRRSRKVLPEGGPVDDLLLRLAAERGAAVATNDKELKRRLRRAGVPIVYPRRRMLEVSESRVTRRGPAPGGAER